MIRTAAGYGIEDVESGDDDDFGDGDDDDFGGDDDDFDEEE